MLDNLFDSIKDQVVDSITGETELNQEQAVSMLPLAKESLQNGLLDQVKSGNLEGILGMFNSSGGNLMNNSIFDSIKQQLIGLVTEKLGISSTVATMAANVGLSKIIGSISNQAQDGSGAITQEGLLSTLGMGGGIEDIAKNMLKDKLGGLGGLFGN